MNKNDFRYMRRGKTVSDLSQEDSSLLNPINQRGTGCERALLVLHGFSSSPAVYRLLVPHLKHYDAIVGPALPGHAQTIEAFSLAKASEWLDVACTTCEALIKEYKKVDVLGLSMGGLLAYELSQRYSLNHLYLLAPALKLRLRINAMLILAQVLKRLGFKTLRNAAGNLMSIEQAEIAYKKLPIPVIIEILQLIKNYQWAKPTCPVDLFLGVHDEVVASEEVGALFISEPQVSVHWLKQSAHVLPLDSDLEDIINCINSKTKA